MGRISATRAAASWRSRFLRSDWVADGTRLSGYVLLFLGAMLVLLVYGGDSYSIRIANLVLIYAIAALGLNVALGYAGIISLAQGSLMGAGAYTWAYATGTSHLGTGLGLLLAIAIPALIGGSAGALATRVQGHYFIVVTIGVQQGLVTIFTNVRTVTGGAAGEPVNVKPDVFGYSISTPTQFYVFSTVVLVVSLFICQRLRKSRLGRGILGVGQSEFGAAAAGIAPSRHRVAAMGVAGAFAGLAGALFAPFNGYIDPTSFDIGLSVLLIVMVIVGGLGSNVGVIVGAAIIVLLRNYVQSSSGSMLIYGALVVGIILVLPSGVGGARDLVRIGSRRVRSRLVQRTGRLQDRAHESIAGAASVPESDELDPGLADRFRSEGENRP